MVVYLARHVVGMSSIGMSSNGMSSNGMSSIGMSSNGMSTGAYGNVKSPDFTLHHSMNHLIKLVPLS